MWYSKKKKDTLKRKCLNLRNMSLAVEFEAISVSNGDRDSFKAKRCFSLEEIKCL